MAGTYNRDFHEPLRPRCNDHSLFTPNGFPLNLPGEEGQRVWTGGIGGAVGGVCEVCGAKV